MNRYGKAVAVSAISLAGIGACARQPEHVGAPPSTPTNVTITTIPEHPGSYYKHYNGNPRPSALCTTKTGTLPSCITLG